MKPPTATVNGAETHGENGNGTEAGGGTLTAHGAERPTMSPKSGGIPRPIGKREARRIVREHLALMIHGLDLPDLVWPEEVLDVFCDETERAATLIAPWLYASPPRPTVEGMGG